MTINIDKKCPMAMPKPNLAYGNELLIGNCIDDCAWKDDETGECAILILAKEQKKANRIAQKAFGITLDNPIISGVTNRVRGVVEKLE